MRVVVNEALISRNRKISHALFFISLIGMGLGFFYTWTSDPSSGASSQISCMVLPMLLLMTLTSVRMANTWIREPRPISVLAESLKGLNKQYTMFHHLLPAPHVLIGPEGVFALTVIWQERPYRVKGAKWHGDQGMLRRLNGFMRQDLLGNPFQDAQFSTQQLQRLINKIAPDRDIEVQPLIVFIHPEAVVEIEDPLFPVLYADNKKKPSLRQYLKELPAGSHPTLEIEDIDKIDEMYGLVTRRELAEMAGQTWEEPENEVDAADAPDAADDIIDDEEHEAGEFGTVYVLQAGQLFYIGSTTGAVEDEIAQLQPEAEQTLEVIHSFEVEDPEAMAAYLQQKYARKRQKEIWYGLSKKDVAWLKSRRGELR